MYFNFGLIQGIWNLINRGWRTQPVEWVCYRGTSSNCTLKKWFTL